jgi:hypothetical protein
VSGYSPYLGKRAEQVRPGTCLVCLCTDLFGCPTGCSWEEGTGHRLCSNHTGAEKIQARNALHTADAAKKEKRHG